MNYVRKVGSLALLIVAAFAVAVTVLVSSPTTSTDASIESRNSNGTFTTGSGNRADASNGDTVYIQNTNTAYVQFEIETTGSASASFTHGDASDNGQTIVCNPAGTTPTCDVDTVDGGVTVALKIDDDSGKGAIFVTQTQPASPESNAAVDTISVTVAQVPTALTAKLGDKSINSGQGAGQTAASTLLDIRLTDADGAGIEGKAITVVSSRALLTAATGDDLTRTVSGEDATLLPFSSGETGALAGTVSSSVDGGSDAEVDTRGYARVVVTGGGSAGISTITVTMGELSTSVELILHGPVKTIEASAEQSAIEVGGDTFIVVTATDSAGNPVKDQNVSAKTRGGVTAPAKLAVPVMAVNNVNKDGGTAGSLTDKGDIPSCGNRDAVEGQPDATPVVVAVAASTGTNDAGQCVIRVNAPNPAGTSGDAARGTHTITLVASNEGGDGPQGVNEASLEVQVGGAPATIESDAPERIDPSAELTVNITVIDDESVRVGGVSIEVLHTAGDGAIIAEAADMTSDGRAKFTYIAPSTPGVTEFLVRTKSGTGAVTAQLPIIIAIAEEAPEPPPVVEPEVPEAMAPGITGYNPMAGGSGLVVFTDLTSIDDALGLLDCGGTTGTTITLTLMDGSSAVYTVGAPAFANSGFNDNVEFPIALTAAFVSCK